MKVPVVALRPAERVNALEPVAGLGLNEAVVPLRAPEAESVTLPVKPFVGVIVMVVAAFAPRAMLRLVGEAERLKLDEPLTALTVREIVVDLVSAPFTPFIVTVKVPVVAVALAVRVSVLVVAVLVGLNEAVTPLGKPEAERLTVPLNPLSGLTVMVLLMCAPCVTPRPDGAADRVKLGAGVTVSETETWCVKLPEVPVTVTVTVPVAAAPDAVKVRALLVVAALGLKAAVTPDGNPEADRVTLPLKPFCGVTTTVVPLLEP